MLTAQINELSAAMEQIKSIPGYESDETCMGQLAQLEAQVPSLSNIVTLLGGSNAAILGTAQYFEAVQGGATELVNGLAQLDGSYEQFDAAIANLVNSVSGIADKVGALKSGVDQLAESYGSLNGESTATQAVSAPLLPLIRRLSRRRRHSWRAAGS